MKERRVALADVVVLNPRMPKFLAENQEQSVAFVPMASVSERGILTEFVERPLREVIKGFTYFESGDVLLAKITPCMENGKACLVPVLPNKVGFGSTEFHVLRATEAIDRRYLFHCVWNADFRKAAAKNMTGSAGQKRVPSHFLSTYKIPLPPLPEQKRIAAILDKADAIRRKREKAIELTDSFLRSVFLEMFGDPVLNSKGWREIPLGELVDFRTGKLDSNAAVANGQYPFFTCARETFWIDTFAFDCKALLLAGNNAEGKYSVKLYEGKFNAYQRTYVMTLKTSSLSYEYLKYVIENKLNFLRHHSKGTNTKYLTLGLLQSIKVQVPAIALQDQFARLFNKITADMGGRMQQSASLIDHLAGSLSSHVFKASRSVKSQNCPQIQEAHAL